MRRVPTSPIEPRTPSTAVVRGCVVLAAWLAAVRASPLEAPRAEPARDGGRVEELRPELFYLEDDGGRLVPVPGFRYRDFVELYRIREGLAAPLLPPGAVLDSVAVSVDAREPPRSGDGPARMACPTTAEFGIRQLSGGWTPIRLRLDGLVLTAPPRHDGPGRMILDVDPGGGYRAWVEPQPGADGETRHTVVLEGRLPGEWTPGHDSIAVSLPAAVTSRIDVRTPRPAAAAAVSPPSVEPDVAAEPDGGSRVSVRGAAGEVRLRIGRPDGEDPRGPAAQASTESSVRIDGRTAVTEAVIRFANLAAAGRPLTISLPPEATLREVRPPATLLARGGTADAPTVEVAVPVDGEGRASVELVCERPIDPTGGASFEAVGFAVAGFAPWRQWGRVSVVVDGEWLAAWGESPGLRRVDPPTGGRQRGFVAAFAYDTLPASLPLRVRPRQSRMVIEPEYRYEVSGAKVSLDARLRVAARGAPVGSIAIGIDPAWVIDEVGPPGAVDAAASTSVDGLLTVPFAQPLAGDTVIQIRATLPLSKDAGRVVWSLPVPRADVVGPAAVVIASPGGIELLPDNETITGLVRQTAASVAEVDTGALVYRLDAAEGVFAANRRFLPRRIDASIAAQASIDPAEIACEQVIRLNVLHVPLESIELAVPEAVVAAGGPVIRHEDTLVDSAEVGGLDAYAAGTTDTRRFRAILHRPLLGTGEITVGFRLPVAAIAPRSTLAVDLPLVEPVDVAIGRQTVSVSSPDSMIVGVRGDAWRRDVAAAASQSWTAMKAQRVIPLTLAMRAAETARSMVVEAAWLQTRLLADGREEIRRYVISSARDAVAMVLPDAGGDGEPAGVFHEVRLDGEVVPASPARGRLVVDLPAADPTRRWRLDVRTTLRQAGGWAGLAAGLALPRPLRLAAPVFDPPVREQRFYWTVHLRPDERVVGMPAGWTSQQRWQRASFGWEQVPAATPLEISDWIASVAAETATAEPTQRGFPMPPLAERTAVFSGVGRPGDARLWLVPIWFVVLVASGASLVAALGAIHRPGWRRPVVWTPLAAAVAVAAAAFPDVAPLVAQAAVPGIALGGVAWLLRHIAGGGGTAGRREPQPAASSLGRIVAPSHSLIVAPGVGTASTASRVDEQ